ncbi:adrenocorticotropic hormone receptor-like [Exaiptasia diaphana]|uniref:G-protein coupled receptors family 1 profile domain-containing protein n=1 Tax=Exaiptasia diaphana TaxID=2652724 RepID=A0A913YBL8_EXADI|nr:adrenocorticotropic hormone receptor-like [Exaiptasia diaphana]
MDNSTAGHPPETVDVHFFVSMIVINAFSGLLATVLNLLVIITFIKTPSLRTTSNILILSLAITDFGVGALVQPKFCIDIYANITDNLLILSSTALIILGFCPVILTWVSVLTTTAITADRFLAVHLHLRYQELVTKKRISMVVITIWTFSVFFGACLVLFLLKRMHFALMIILPISNFLFLSFLLINIALMLKISCVIRQHAAQIHAQQQAMNAAPGAARNIKRSVNIMYYVVGTFSLCYFPEISRWIIITFMPKLNLKLKIAMFLFQTLLYMNSSINPIIYFWRIQDMRNAALQLLRSFRKIRNNNNNDNSNATNISNCNL